MKGSSRVALLTVLFVALGVPVFSYEIPEAVYPALPRSGKAAEAFVPAGWGIEVLEKGDLNGDKREDLLIVLKEKNPANMMVNDPMTPGVDEWDANPRILAVAFARAKGDYELALQNDGFLPRHEDPCIDDPFGGAEIADGAIQVRYHFWANAGSWYTSGATFTFRYRDKRFRLVAYSNLTTKRNTGEMWDLKLDYVGRKAEMKVGSFSDDEEEEKTYLKDLPRKPLLTLEEISSVDGFYPEQNDLSWWGISGTDSETAAE